MAASHTKLCENRAKCGGGRGIRGVIQLPAQSDDWANPNGNSSGGVDFRKFELKMRKLFELYPKYFEIPKFALKLSL